MLNDPTWKSAQRLLEECTAARAVELAEAPAKAAAKAAEKLAADDAAKAASEARATELTAAQSPKAVEGEEEAVTP